MYYVYFLLLADNTVYKGFSESVRMRLKEHERGKVQSTKYKLPCRLIGYEGYALKSDARRRERFFKTTEGRRLLRQQYRDILKTWEQS